MRIRDSKRRTARPDAPKGARTATVVVDWPEAARSSESVTDQCGRLRETSPVSGHDARDREALLQALQTSEARCATLLESSELPGAYWDLHGFCTRINRAGAVEFARTVTECIGQSVEDLLPLAIAAAFRESLLLCVTAAEETAVMGPLSTAECADWFSTSFLPLFNAAGNVAGVQTVSTCLRESAGAAYASRRREQLLSSVSFAAEQFLQPGNWNARIDEVLARIGQAAGVSHVYLCEVEWTSSAEVFFQKRALWSLDSLPEIPTDNASHRGNRYWIDRLGRGDLVCGRSADFPQAEYPPLDIRGARTVAAIPVFAASEWWGVIGLADVREGRMLTVAELDALRTAADLLGAAIVRSRIESELRRANRALRTIGACNEILVRAQEESVLLQRVCRALIDIGGYFNAWVGFTVAGQPGNVSRASGYSVDLALNADGRLPGTVDAEREARSIAEALRSGRPFISPAVEFAAVAGDEATHAMISLPLVTSGTLLGALTIHSVKPNPFDELEVYLLEELANDLAYGLQALRTLRQREEADRALRSSEERFRQLFECAGDSIFLAAEDGRIINVNRTACDVLGYEREEMLLRGMAEIDDQFNAERFPQIIEQLRTTGYLVLESAFRRRNATTFPVEIRLTPLVWDERPIVLGIVRDMTERTHALEEKRDLERQFFEAQKLESIGTLAGGIAHDFNNILAIILGYVSGMKSGAGLDAAARHGLHAVEEAVDRGAGLVRQILTFARRNGTVYGPIDVNLMLKELKRMMQETFPRTIDVRLQLARNLPLIMADATQIHQALLNICVNARDAMPSGGQLTLQTAQADALEVRTLFSDAAAAAYLHISIVDTGFGMDESLRARIFEPFFTTKEVGKGTGLGLAVSYGAVRNHDGFMHVESSPGQGSTFHLYLPVPATTAAVHTPEAPVDVSIARGSGTILIIEDEALISGLLATALERAGFRTLIARDGVEGIALFEQHMQDIDLVLSDLGLPRLSGVDAIRWMRKHRPDLTVVATTGYLESEIRAELEELGVADIIQKPCGIIESIQRITRAMSAGMISRTQ